MRYLKVYELFNKKKKGNYLTKESQPKDTFNEYLYDNGFDDRFYVCNECDSYKLTPIPKGGMQSPEWHCDNCGEINYSPKWMSPDEYKDYIKDKFKIGDYFIYSDPIENYYLLQFLSITIFYTNHYIYNLKPLFELRDEKIKKDTRKTIGWHSSLSALKDGIKYYSDNFEDVKKHFDYILNEKIIKKYNI
jgi:hypothetical protein